MIDGRSFVRLPSRCLRVLCLTLLLSSWCAVHGQTSMNFNQWYDSVTIPASGSRQTLLSISPSSSTTMHFYPCFGFFNIYIGVRTIPTTTSYFQRILWDDAVTSSMSNVQAPGAQIYVLVQTNQTLPTTISPDYSGAFSFFVTNSNANSPVPVPPQNGRFAGEFSPDLTRATATWPLTTTPSGTYTYQVYYLIPRQFPFGHYRGSGCAVKKSMVPFTSGISYTSPSSALRAATFGNPTNHLNLFVTVLVTNSAGVSAPYFLFEFQFCGGSTSAYSSSYSTGGNGNNNNMAGGNGRSVTSSNTGSGSDTNTASPQDVMGPADSTVADNGANNNNGNNNGLTGGTGSGQVSGNMAATSSYCYYDGSANSDGSTRSITTASPSVASSSSSARSNSAASTATTSSSTAASGPAGNTVGGNNNNNNNNNNVATSSSTVSTVSGGGVDNTNTNTNSNNNVASSSSSASNGVTITASATVSGGNNNNNNNNAAVTVAASAASSSQSSATTATPVSVGATTSTPAASCTLLLSFLVVMMMIR
eukprot:TRINITY_DN2432_c0_g1_i3.p1 TRINITY_DN2432_c0_g1~~TRINITY_DN2432_c0_g1_i3.p1  ORF type:complete len:534 (-),score=123.74 TRINITY_DN2432_c0_g1_i3:71-1672(-)